MDATDWLVLYHTPVDIRKVQVDIMIYLAWLRSCLVTWLLLLNRLGQIEHWNGFSPVCQRSWMVTSLFSLNRLGHIEHEYGLCPEWIRSWMTTLLLLASLARAER